MTACEAVSEWGRVTAWRIGRTCTGVSANQTARQTVRGLVKTCVDVPIQRCMRDDMIGRWLVGVFHHDPSDDSHFWVEQQEVTGEERLGTTGPHREGLYINGTFILPADVLHLDVDPDRAREQYLEVGHYLTALIQNKPDN